MFFCFLFISISFFLISIYGGLEIKIKRFPNIYHKQPPTIIPMFTLCCQRNKSNWNILLSNYSPPAARVLAKGPPLLSSELLAALDEHDSNSHTRLASRGA